MLHPAQISGIICTVPLVYVVRYFYQQFGRATGCTVGDVVGSSVSGQGDANDCFESRL